jgi:hypothetical protein
VESHPRQDATNDPTPANAGESEGEVALPIEARPRPAEAPVGGMPRKRRKGPIEWIEGFISKLSTRNNFWHRVCSFVWLPYAFRSGIRMKRVDASTFTAVLPFKRFNRNWYNAMAGASLLANSEIAGGMYVFSAVGKDYTVVCKELGYRFLRPCFGPAVYRVTPEEDLEALIATGGEFNIPIVMNVYQQLKVPGTGKEKRVGRCRATFHVTPKEHYRERRQRVVERAGAGGSVGAGVE